MSASASSTTGKPDEHGLIVHDESDERGWSVLDVAPIDTATLSKVVRVHVEIGIGNKKLKLVRQAQWMRVYVNPDIYGPDEWEVPPSSGIKWYVIGPYAPRVPHDEWQIISPDAPRVPHVG